MSASCCDNNVLAGDWYGGGTGLNWGEAGWWRACGMKGKRSQEALRKTREVHEEVIVTELDPEENLVKDNRRICVVMCR